MNKLPAGKTPLTSTINSTESCNREVAILSGQFKRRQPDVVEAACRAFGTLPQSEQLKWLETVH